MLPKEFRKELKYIEENRGKDYKKVRGGIVAGNDAHAFDSYIP